MVNIRDISLQKWYSPSKILQGEFSSPDSLYFAFLLATKTLNLENNDSCDEKKKTIIICRLFSSIKSSMRNDDVFIGSMQSTLYYLVRNELFTWLLIMNMILTKCARMWIYFKVCRHLRSWDRLTRTISSRSDLFNKSNLVRFESVSKRQLSDHLATHL